MKVLHQGLFQLCKGNHRVVMKCQLLYVAYKLYGQHWTVSISFTTKIVNRVLQTVVLKHELVLVLGRTKIIFINTMLINNVNMKEERDPKKKLI